MAFSQGDLLAVGRTIYILVGWPGSSMEHIVTKVGVGPSDLGSTVDVECLIARPQPSTNLIPNSDLNSK